MTDLQSPAVPAVVLHRTYPVPRERVYAAWTNPETATRFFGPGDVVASDIAMDVRLGGKYSITMTSPEMGRMTVRGTYVEVKPPERLAMTWRWEEDTPAEEYDSLLTLEFHENNGHTDFVLRHEKIATQESRDRHEGGWTAIVDQLAGVF
jgi:uncharacterized protein YndB with AHSA1/START domain